MPYKVLFGDRDKNYLMIKDEIDAAYNEVMENGDLIMRDQLRSFEINLANFVGTKYAVVNAGEVPVLVDVGVFIHSGCWERMVMGCHYD